MKRRRLWQGILDRLWSAAAKPVQRTAATPEACRASAGVAAPAERAACAAAAPGEELTGDAASEALVLEASHDELLEFLSGDIDPVPADPVFRDELREQLWSIVEEGALSRSKDH